MVGEINKKCAGQYAKITNSQLKSLKCQEKTFINPLKTQRIKKVYRKIVTELIIFELLFLLFNTTS